MLLAIESSGIKRICSIGSPHSNDKDHIYIPKWILENLGLDALEFENFVSVQPFLENIPSATKIVIKPLDNAIYHTDIRECFEVALQTFHVLSEGTLLKVCIPSLGDYEVSAYVDSVEPGPVVRLGGEVHVDFLEPEHGIPEFVPASVNVPDEVVASTTASTSESIVEEDPKVRQEAIRNSWLKKFGKLKE